ncbi:hypothetical protein OQJ13_12605 [Legionella sp. PATHC035]|uniref:hypothetical protein n=1 Tax=Legionella sp. PATHC035 TaxID=2992040 RepID=UPI002242E5D0|nr:hypothetical protein [Legionella sp. PATHC035]MCW8409811.1 hypothetical protein [Legionella sp. PATHC035]
MILGVYEEDCPVLRLRLIQATFTYSTIHRFIESGVVDDTWVMKKNALYYDFV